MICNEDELKKIVTKSNLIPIEVDILDTSKNLFIKLNGIEKFLEFANNNNVEYVFYFFTNYYIESYIIPSEWYSEYPVNMQKEIVQRNKDIETQKFNRPIGLTLFIVKEGIYLTYEMYDFWLEELDIIENKEAFNLLEERYSSEIEKIIEQKEEEAKCEEEELRKIIINDMEFKYCTNQQARYNYLVDLLKRENMKKYCKLFKRYGAPHSGEIRIFMDKTWKVYKEIR